MKKNTTYLLQHLFKQSQLTKIFPMARISTFTLYDREGKGVVLESFNVSISKFYIKVCSYLNNMLKFWYLRIIHLLPPTKKMLPFKTSQQEADKSARMRFVFICVPHRKPTSPLRSNWISVSQIGFRTEVHFNSLHCDTSNQLIESRSNQRIETQTMNSPDAIPYMQTE